MQYHDETSFDTLADEAYCAQLRKGFAALRFDPALERLYHRHSSATLGLAQRLAASFAVLLGLLLLSWEALHFGRSDAGGPIAHAVAVRMASLLLLLWVALSIHCARRHGPGRIALLLLIVGTGLVLSSVGYPPQELRYAVVVMALVILAGFLPLGLSLRQSVAVALGLCAVSAAAGRLVLDGAAQAGYLRLQWLLWAALLVGVVGGYLREHARRKAFLQQRIRDDEALRNLLTGLGDRCRFDEHLALARAESARLQINLGLILVELDGFAEFARRHGPREADRAVLDVAEAMQCLLRPLDVLMRIDVHRFALVLYDASAAHLRQVAPALREMVDIMASAHTGIVSAPLSISVGALLATPTVTTAALMQHAEDLLQRARSSGGNQVVLAEETA
ncbi:GGDEF domain-containing protein [Xanthomonas sp. MUS 060]|uniref:GGDEF domain-containing protein n=1 Tax=Xanthomonas sp. MUS 060 TaxID=1588031 RepID=UPI0005F2ADC4|nr:GGDEF domain-containing protein [Xanthomonas sp. MUS 060]